MSQEKIDPTPAASASAPPAAASSAPAPASPPATQTTGAPGQPTPTAQAPNAAEAGWREKFAGEDKDFLKQLGRYNSEADYIKSTRELRAKLDSGEYKKISALPDNATPEQVAEYRKENGIPESADKYEVKLPQGLVIADADKPAVNKFLEKAHKNNMPVEAANKALASYYETVAEVQAQVTQQDRQFQAQTEESLRKDWGSEYLANKNVAEDFATQRFGNEVGKALMSAGADVVKAVASIAREINPAMTLVPNSSDPLKAVQGELESLRKEVGSKEWMRNPAKQQRYLDLMAGEDAMKKRA